MVRYLKKNSCGGLLLNSFTAHSEHTGHVGPYLCKDCDNVTFSRWEGRFKNAIFDKLDNAGASWFEESAIKFLLSVLFRYSIHHLEASIPQSDSPIAKEFRDLSRRAIDDLSLVGTSLFIYPYIYSPITQTCDLAVGTNHVLSLLYSGGPLDAEDGEPHAFLVFLPGVMLLFTAGKLPAVQQLPNPQDLNCGSTGNVNDWNRGLPVYLKWFVDRAIHYTTAHQKSIGTRFWGKVICKADRRLFPQRQVYKARQFDAQLKEWQELHCV